MTLIFLGQLSFNIILSQLVCLGLFLSNAYFSLRTIESPERPILMNYRMSREETGRDIRENEKAFPVSRDEMNYSQKHGDTYRVIPM